MRDDALVRGLPAPRCLIFNARRCVGGWNVGFVLLPGIVDKASGATGRLLGKKGLVSFARRRRQTIRLAETADSGQTPRLSWNAGNEFQPGGRSDA